MRKDVVWWLRHALLVAAILHLTVVLYVSFRRCFYPFELEWMEGAMVDHVERVLTGQKLYVEPSVDFVPFIYGPLFFWVSAAVAKVVGLSFVPLRLVSIASMVSAFGLLFAIVSRETGDRRAGAIAAGAFAASYVRSAQFLDLGRVDSLALVLSLASIHVMRNLRHRRLYWLLGALLLLLSFLAKQSSFLLAFALIAHEFLADRGAPAGEPRRAIPFAVVTLLSTFVVAWLLDWMHSGWFRYYTWELPRSHPFVQHALFTFWTDDLAPVYGIAAVFAGFFLIVAPPPRDGARLFHLLAAGGLIASAWTGRLHDGGWPNVLIPAFAALSMLFGLGVAAATRAASDAEPVNQRLHSFVLAAALVQLAVLGFDPKRALPRGGDVVLGHQLIARLRDVKGDVFIPNHSWYARMAGKKPHAHRMAMDDVLRGDPHGEGLALAVQLRRAFADKRWKAVLLDDDFLEGDALRTYELTSPPFPSREGFYPPTGIHVRPQKMLVALP